MSKDKKTSDEKNSGKDRDSKLILLSSGGTGGHMTPAEALARDLLDRGYRVSVITDRRGMRYEDMFAGIPMHEVRAGTLGKGWRGKIGGVFNVALGILQARRLIRKLKPSLVVGFGGYPSVPGVYAAQRMRVPTIIHEQNAIIGKANDFLAKKAFRIALSVGETSGLSEDERINSVQTGNPVRAEIAALYSASYPNLGERGTFRIFVMGGSLGASVFSDIVPRALARLPKDLRERLHIVQQCRKDDLDRVEEAYQKAGIKADLNIFFGDVAEQLRQAHLIIARSGASTVAEVTAAGRPAIFVPYPHHRDQQQKMNADAVADVGGAWTMTEEGFTEDTLLARIETFFQNPKTLFRAAEKARTYGRPDAARKLGNLVTAVASGWDDMDHEGL